MTDYALEFQKRSSPAYIAAAVKRSKQLLAQYGTWINKYRGGLPAGWAAAIMYWESNGMPGTVGDSALGEIGLYQVAEYVPATLGMPAAARLDPEKNVFIGLMEYQLEAAKWKAMFPSLVQLGSADSWKLARLSFSVGFGGATSIAKKAQSMASSGALYSAIVRYVDANGGMQLGSQSPDKVWFRVKSIEGQWQIGRQVGGMLDGPGVPTLVDAPPGAQYALPKKYAAMFSRPIPMLAVAAVATAGLVLWSVL